MTNPGGGHSQQPGGPVWKERKIQGSRTAVQESLGDQREGTITNAWPVWWYIGALINHSLSSLRFWDGTTRT